MRRRLPGNAGIPADVPLGQVRRRLIGRGFWLPSLSTEGVTSATSTRATATATASATPHTKGAWTQVIAATATDVTFVSLCLTGNTNTNTVDTSTLLDIGVGGAGSEAVVAGDIGVGYKTLGNAWDIPLRIPAGSRLAIRCQSAVISKTVAMMFTLSTFPFGRLTPPRLVTIAADETTSKGVSLAVPGATNTKTAYTELVASTTEPFGALVLCEQGSQATVMAAGTALVDIAVGVGGGESIIIPDVPYSINSSEAVDGFGHGRSFPVDIPLGSRIAARWASSTTTNRMDLILLGVPRQ